MFRIRDLTGIQRPRIKPTALGVVVVMVVVVEPGSGGGPATVEGGGCREAVWVGVCSRRNFATPAAKRPERFEEREKKKGPEKPGERAGFFPQLQSDNSWGKCRAALVPVAQGQGQPGGPEGTARGLFSLPS